MPNETTRSGLPADTTTSYRPTSDERMGSSPEVLVAQRHTAPRQAGPPQAAAAPPVPWLVLHELAPTGGTAAQRAQARDDRRLAEEYGWRVFRAPEPGTEFVRGLRNWEDFYATLARARHVEHMVITFHGADGLVGLGNKSKELDEVAAGFADPGPVVDAITFESCNVARGAPQMVQLARRLRAKSVTGWNHFWIHSILTVETAKGSDSKLLASKIAPYRRWLLPGSLSPEQMVAKGGRFYLVVEWFREDNDEEVLPATHDVPDDRPRTFKPRSRAENRVIAPDSADAFVKEMEAPVSSLIRLTIDMTRDAPGGGRR